ncbi:MAG: T9SS type A sorting domain-containing protein [Bacteroidales bacterium]|nr:T9SS type A sorting domain-containing protein [Bacteroidales bacterium]
MRGLITLFLIFMIPYHAQAQYIHRVHDYKPAPGQFINAPGGTRESALGITGEEGGLVSLGAFGGYIVFSFEQEVDNHPENPYGVDFVIFGNATDEFSEPGIVSVMQDTNHNGLPDDIWFELAGSDYSFNSTLYNYSIKYYEPISKAADDVVWVDGFNNSGKISANSFHTQSYYPAEGFDTGFYSGSCSFIGSKIEAETDFSDAFRIKSFPRNFGYADNIQSTGDISGLPDNPYTKEVEGMGGDGMDISWAVDSLGNNVYLEKIHFVKVHTAVLGEAGPLGEFSTEIRSALDIAPVAGSPNNILLNNSHESMRVFPNPFVDHIQINGVEGWNIELLNAQGKIICKFVSQSEEQYLNTQKLIPGIYFIKIFNTHKTKIFTLVKSLY